MLLRPAEPQDAMGVARVHVRSWQAGYRGLLPDAYLDGLRAEDRARQALITRSNKLLDYRHQVPNGRCSRLVNVSLGISPEGSSGNLAGRLHGNDGLILLQ